MKPQRHKDTKTKEGRRTICLSAISLCLCVLVIEIVSHTRAEKGPSPPNQPTAATAETLEATLEQMKVVEDMRRTLRDIRSANKLDSS